MKKLLFSCLFLTSIVHAQIGLGTANPQATLDVVAINPSGTSALVDGFIVQVSLVVLFYLNFQ